MAVQPARHRFTVHEYHQMADGGVFSENDDRVELLEGQVVEMAPISSLHAVVEVCRRPENGGSYQEVRLVGPDEDLASQAFPDASLVAGDLLT